MIKKLAPYMKKYKTQLMLGVLCAAYEAEWGLFLLLWLRSQGGCDRLRGKVVRSEQLWSSAKAGFGLRTWPETAHCRSYGQAKASLYPSVPGGWNAVFPGADGLSASAGRLESAVCTQNTGGGSGWSFCGSLPDALSYRIYGRCADRGWSGRAGGIGGRADEGGKNYFSARVHHTKEKGGGAPWRRTGKRLIWICLSGLMVCGSDLSVVTVSHCVIRCW